MSRNPANGGWWRWLAARRAAPLALSLALASTLGLVLPACDPVEDDDDSSPSDPGDPPTVELGSDVVAFVGDEVTLTAEASESATSFTWTWSDDAPTDTTTAPTASHSWTEPGHWRAFVEASDAVGRTVTDSVLVTVVHPPLDPAPRQSAPIAMDDSGARIFASLRDFNLVVVIDVALGTIIDHVETCGGPRGLSAADGLLAVACSKDDAVDLFELADDDGSGPPELGLTHLATVQTGWGSSPFSVVVEDAGRVWATLEGDGELVAIDPSLSEPAIVARVPVLPDLRGLAVADGVAYVSRNRSPPDAGLWAAVDTTTMATTQHSLSLDPGPDSDTGSRGVPTYLQSMAMRPDGRVLAFPALQANNQRGLWRDGQPLTHETSVRATLRHVDLPGGEERTRRSFDGRGLASAAAYNPLGDWLFVAMRGRETIEVLDAFTMQTGGAFADVGNAPDGLVVTPDGDTLWVLASGSRELVAYSLVDLGAPQDELHRMDLLPPSGEVLEPDYLLGRQIFDSSADIRMTRDGYLSCASCHLDGRGDNRVWDFTDRGEGMRNTVTLAGRSGVGHGPIHWSGNFDEVQDFENDIRGPQQGAGFLDDADWDATSDTLGPPRAGLSPELDALAVYVEGLNGFPRSPYRDDDGAPSAEAEAGALLFEQPALGCLDCHPAPEYTDSTFLGPGDPLLHDVGTMTEASGGRLGGELPGIDTPTLRGIWTTAPYLHDGSAATLREVLVDRNPDDEHGVTSGLSEGELDELIAFLLALE